MMRYAKPAMLLGLFTLPLAAAKFGGWSVITIRDVPEYAVAGKPIELSFDVRQHGQTLMGGLSPEVTATSGATEVKITATGSGEGAYTARIVPTTPGAWTIKIAAFGFVEGAGLPLKVIAAGAPAPAPLSPLARGEQLFLAKGCVTCHSHQLTKGFQTTGLGPDLSEPKFASAYLTRFLANPSIKTDWKSQWRMPNMELKPAEIQALIAFLNQEPTKSR